MKIEELVDCIDNEQCVDRFEEILALLEGNLLTESFDEDQVCDVFMSLRAALEEKKEYQKLLQLIQVLKVNQVGLYQNFNFIFDSFLVDYHCFFGAFESLEGDFEQFVAQPDASFTEFLVAFKKALYYRQIELTDSIINQVYSKVVASEQIFDEQAPYDLAIAKYYTIIQTYFVKWAENHTFNKNQFKKDIAEYGFDLNSHSIKAIEYGLFKEQEKIDDFFSKSPEHDDMLLLVECLFLKKMILKGFHFALSGSIWAKFSSFLMYQQEIKKAKTNKDYLRLDPKVYQTYLLDLATENLSDNSAELVAVLWGTVYIYDFLFEIGLVDEEIYFSFLETTKRIKASLICVDIAVLWNYDFIHHWQKAESVTAAEFEAEHLIFQKSFSMKEFQFAANEPEIKEELENIGELASYIHQASGDDAFRLERDQMMNDKADEMRNEIERLGREAENEKQEPIRVDKNIGRNDPCPCGSGKKYKKCCGSN